MTNLANSKMKLAKNTIARWVPQRVTASMRSGPLIIAWKHRLPDVIQGTSMWLIDSIHDGDIRMFDEFDTIKANQNLDIVDGQIGFSREKISQYLSAGILLPDEVRFAEQILRRLEK
jgi:adenine deaminase